MPKQVNNGSLCVSPNVATDESKLVAGLQNGHYWAFAALYERYAPSLLDLLMRMVNDQPQAEDLLQESFIKVWRNMHQYDPARGRLFTWLLNITRHTAHDHLAKKHPLRYCTDMAACSTQHVPVVTPYLEAEIEQVVNTHLPEKYRILINLVYYQGYKQQEAADYLALPLGTVKTRLRQAIQYLRVVFAQY